MKQSLALGPVRIEAIGRPRTKGSLKPIHRKLGNGRCTVSLTESGEYSKEWKERIISAVRAACELERWDGPIVMDTYHRFERLCVTDVELEWPTRQSGEWAHGDDDKLRRQDGDALEQSGLILNDSLIVGGRTWKRWCDAGERPGVVIKVRIATPEDLIAIKAMER